MTNGNIKTWPEKISLVPRSEGKFILPNNLPLYCSLSEVGWSDDPNRDLYSHVEYIRADIAKEREGKLIRAAIGTTTERFRPDLDDFIQASDIDDAYHEAGLGKLK